MENTGNDLVEFLCMDFKEISEKLESTDRKVQFCIQLYITLITAILTALSTGFLTNSDQLYLYMTMILLIFFFVGQFILLYMMSGQKVHLEYVCRLNIIRSLVLREIGKSEDFIEKYGYTSCKAPSKIGMNSWMIYLTDSVLAALLCGSIYCTWKACNDIYITILFAYIPLSFTIINLVVHIKHFKRLDYIAKENESNKQLIISMKEKEGVIV